MLAVNAILKAEIFTKSHLSEIEFKQNFACYFSILGKLHGSQILNSHHYMHEFLLVVY